ncbi:hypothetical protein L1785_13865 [Antribacter sp. KLBMP9083]|uniref:Uncharacterized protein n=1 Tax=Antribacter soli TaxID=2910976 RepID=A0AA41QEM6_9MICO|nr:hypothetical protein [Antribacter soli]MCF4122065.1 hypothetical protein [Antribacter soli]
MTAVAPPAALVEQVRAPVEEWHPRLHPVSVRVRLDGTGPELSSCEVWTGDADTVWARRADLVAAAGHTMLDLERALVAAGYVYDLTPDGRPKYRFDANDRRYTLDITRPW